jgi:hypothetical protein
MGLQVDFDTQWAFEMTAMLVAIQAVISLSAFGSMSGIVMVSNDKASHAGPIFVVLQVDFTCRLAFAGAVLGVLGVGSSHGQSTGVRWGGGSLSSAE